MLDKDIEKILITREEIQNRCSELGKELTEIYKDKNPLVVGVLKGAVPFMAERDNFFWRSEDFERFGYKCRRPRYADRRRYY